jgi:hypothetical protein
LSLWLLWHRVFGYGEMGWFIEVSLLILNNLSGNQVFLLMSLEGPPSIGTYKVNWDVVVDTKHEWIGIGIIVRDYEGIVLAARSTTGNFLVEHVVAEALTTLQAV